MSLVKRIKRLDLERDVRERTVDNIKHKVVCYYVSPFNNLERRCGYFEEYGDADTFAAMLWNAYSAYDFPYIIYINGDYYAKNKVNEFDKYLED